MSPESSTKNPACAGVTFHLEVHNGLDGFDDDLDTLMSLYEQLQLFSGDIANPELDLLTFASGAQYFGVLTEYEVHPPPTEEDPKDKDKNNDNDKDKDKYENESLFSNAKNSLWELRSNYQAYIGQSKPKPCDPGKNWVNSKSSARRLNGDFPSKATPKAPQPQTVEVDDVLDIGPLKNTTMEPTFSLAHFRSGSHEGAHNSAMDVENNVKDEEVYEGFGEVDPVLPLEDRVKNVENAMRSFADELDKDIAESSDQDPEFWGNNDDMFGTGTAEGMEKERVLLQNRFTNAYEESTRRFEEETASNTFNNSGWNSLLYGYERGSEYRESLSTRITKSKKQRVIGLIYLANVQGPVDYLRSGELNMGVFIQEGHRRRGYALQAVQIVLEKAFEDRNCNRVQAVVVEGPFKHAAMNVFMKSGFGHEGTRRRAFRSPYTMEFKDVTYLGILATDWVLRHIRIRGGTDSSASSTTDALPVQRLSIAPTSLWDEMLERHQREREELLRWEEGDDQYGMRGLKRSVSNETIKEAFYARDVDDTATDTESVYASGKSRASSISGAGYHTSASSASSPAKKARVDKGKGKSSAVGTGRSSNSPFEMVQVGSKRVLVRKEEPSDFSDSDMDDNGVNIGSWIANTNASIHNTSTPSLPNRSTPSLYAIRSPRSVDTSSESEFSEISRAPSTVADDSASEVGSELSFSSLPSEASASSSWGSNWDMVDGIEYVSDPESRSSGLR